MTIRAEVLATLNALTGPLNDKAWADDQVPTETALPYLSYIAGVSAAPSLSGDGRATAIEELVQIDLWEPTTSEDGSLRNQVWAALDGLLVASGMCRLRVHSAQRIGDPDRNIAHTAFTASVQQRAPR